MKSVTWILVVVLFLSSVTPLTHADYNIGLQKNGATVKILATLTQNVTVLQPSFSAAFLTSNSSSLLGSFNGAARSLAPPATISSLAMNISSNGATIRLELSFRVDGISTINGDLLNADLAWRSLAVRDDIARNGYSLNLVGNAYYLFSLTQLLSRTSNGQLIGTPFLNGQQLRAVAVENATQNFALLDFSFLNTPLDSWQRSFDFTTRTTSWKTTAGFNVTVLSTFQEPGGQFRFTKALLWYVTTARIVAPGPATATGNTLQVDLGGISSLIMSGLVLASAGSLALVYLAERRITNWPRFRSRKSKRNSG